MRTLIAIAALCLAGCNCKSQMVSGESELRVDPASLDFGMTCQKPSNPAFTVRGSTRTVTVSNAGRVALDVAALELDGGPGFSVVAGDFQRTLGASQSFELPLTFLPTKPGTVTGTFTVYDGAGNAASASLTGQGAVASAEPVAALRCPGGRPPANSERCYDVANDVTRPNPLMWFPDTVVGATAELQLQVGNQGCADLEVGAVGIDGGAYAVASAAGFTVEGLGAADAGRSVTVRFTPPAAGTFMGAITLATNKGPLSASLLGLAVAPSLQLCTAGATPQCSTPAVTLTCDFSAPTPCIGDFVVRNSGATALTIDGLALGGANAQFVLTGVPALPAMLAPSGMAGDSLNVSVRYTSRPQFDVDVLTVRSNGGVLKAVVRGGTPPQLVVMPELVDFGAQPNGATAMQSFELRNTGAGPLTIRKVSFVEGGGTSWPSGADIFSVTAPAANSVVQPGGMLTVQVEFKDPPGGGPSGGTGFAAELNVENDDPLWAGFGGKRVTLTARSPCNPPPVAVISGNASPTQGTVVMLDGQGSYDFKSDANGSCQPGLRCTAQSAVSGCPANPIRTYEWSLVSQPATPGGTVSLTPNGSSAALQLGTCAPCSYVVRLTVLDDTPGTGQRSTATDFTVNAR